MKSAAQALYLISCVLSGACTEDPGPADAGLGEDAGSLDGGGRLDAAPRQDSGDDADAGLVRDSGGGDAGGMLSGRNRVAAAFPGSPSAWTFTPDVGFGPEPHRPMGVTFDQSSSLWHLMGRRWGDGVAQLLVTSPTGLDTWTEAPGNPVIVYDDSIAKTDADWYAQMPNYGRYPDSSMRRLDGRWVVVIVNFDGTDSDLQWLTSADGFVWDQRGDTGVDIGPAGSNDRGEQWPTTLVFNPDDSTWYLYYHGGGAYSTGGGRTVGVASGPSPKNLTAWSGSFEDSGLITQNPLVLRDATGWVMVYQHGFDQGDGIWYARSENLLDWTPVGQILESQSVGLLSWVVIPRSDGMITWRIYTSVGGRNGVYEATTPRVGL